MDLVEGSSNQSKGKEAIRIDFPEYDCGAGQSETAMVHVNLTWTGDPIEDNYLHLTYKLIFADESTSETTQSFPKDDINSGDSFETNLGIFLGALGKNVTAIVIPSLPPQLTLEQTELFYGMCVDAVDASIERNSNVNETVVIPERKCAYDNAFVGFSIDPYSYGVTKGESTLYQISVESSGELTAHESIVVEPEDAQYTYHYGSRVPDDMDKIIIKGVWPKQFAPSIHLGHRGPLTGIIFNSWLENIGLTCAVEYRNDLKGANAANPSPLTSIF
ncbi:MAG: hypothetical protein IPJ88_09035 [Myxococcales bacterium]|nr:MAG: hypothetical protein IPJ88_09035 [Myxococcales bacterium]